AVIAEGHRLRTRDRLGGDDGLRLGDVGELKLRGDIADGVDVRHRGAHVVVDVDGAALGELHAGRVEAEALDVRREADGHQNAVGLDGALRAVLAGVGDGDLVAAVHDRLHFGGGEDVDAVALVLAGDLLGDVRVLVGQRPVE